mgnify:CR=1 FL=1
MLRLSPVHIHHQNAAGAYEQTYRVGEQGNQMLPSDSLRSILFYQIPRKM